MKKILFVIIHILMPCLTLIAQVEFEKNVILKEDQLIRPNVIFLADIDNDGYLDMVAGNSYEGRLMWYKNLDGEGRYSEMISIDTEIGDLASLYVADINNDGYLDIVFGNLNDGKIGWYENLDGQGNFGSMQIITSVPAGYSSVIAVDIDGDGDLDIAATCRFSLEILWYENLDGLGDFSVAKVIDTNVSGARSIFAADIDGDGAVDIVAALRGNRKIVWYKNINGLGNFGIQNIISENITRPESIFAVDLDGDGDMDVLVANDFSNLSWFENLDGNGSFGERRQITQDHNAVSNVLAFDIDNDGDMDVVGVGSELIWYEHEIVNNQIVFENSHVITPHILGENAITVGDIDNDGIVDIAIASLNNNFIAWYKNNENGNFETENFISLFVFSPTDILAVDLDGDLDLDIVFTDFLNNQIVWLENTQEGEVFIPHFIATNVPRVSRIAYADIDYDGFVDIVSGSSNENHIAWYKNDGIGNFEKHLLSNGGYIGDTACVEIGDMDGDGINDIITNIGHRLIWYKNQNGDGDFGEPRLIAGNINPSSLAIADINGDGSNDIVSISKIEGKIRYFENINNADYFISHFVGNHSNSYSVVTMDVDDDGKPDVIASNRSSNSQERLVWHKNLGDGNFSPAEVITNSGSELSRLIIGDLDMDAKEDLIYISIQDKKIIWQKNQTGSFESQQTIDITPEIPRAIYVGDIDQNGSLDIIAAFSNPGKIVWYRNSLALSTNEPTQFDNMKIFPNPTDDFVQIYSPNKINKISLYDFSGRKISVQYINNRIDLSQQSSGIYLLKLTDYEGNSEALKIIKR